jgi:putative SOS response-associated peptidase YedK
VWGLLGFATGPGRPYHDGMCGRYALILSGRALAEQFDLPSVPMLPPRYNIAPTQSVPIVRAGSAEPREWREVRWGLIPFWAKDPSIGSRMINARSETAADKPAFRQAVRRRRCLIPASGFYEWSRRGGAKQPWFIHLSGSRAFAFAGLWERWRPAEGDPVDSCTILTTSPNPLVAELHDRMPVILPRERYDEWLSAEELTSERLSALLTAYPADEMAAYPVSPHVNSPANDDPACIERQG